MKNNAQRTVLSLLVIGALFPGNPLTAADPASSISAPEGFEVRLFADDELAHDIFSLTTDSQGQVVVSGPGYVRVLLDQDGDGKADTYRTFTNSPASGAQGLFFDGNDLLCTGDGGLLRYRDRDGNGRADGPPEELLSLKTGGEHFAHAVEQGPDGWWYMILGNSAGMNGGNVSLPSSPVTDPSGGVLMRIAPDSLRTEILADGFRNPYDFAFHANGDIFTFDSDGERDVSLPWYRPTRVFQIMPGAHAGWITSSWKRPGYYPDMPATPASCGRGSPTGVVAYRHTQFPARYRDALFVLDWTFGRVYAIALSARGSSATGTVETFLTANGQFGFAPTASAVAPNGDLLISVGGRGTRGGVYRVRYVGSNAQSRGECTVADPLTRCLSAPQPLASWSRAVWTPIARSLGKQKLVAAVVDSKRSVEQRIRGIEIVTQLFEGLDDSSLSILVRDPSALIRARAAWAIEIQPLDRTRIGFVSLLLRDGDARVVRAALAAVLRNASHPDLGPLLPQLTSQLDAEDPYVWQATWKVIARLTAQQQLHFAQTIATSSQRTRVAYALAITDRQKAVNPPAFDLAWNAFLRTTDPQIKLFAIRAAQKALGDARGHDDLPLVYDGYSNQQEMGAIDVDIPSLVAALPCGNRNTDVELARLIALLAPASSELAEKLCGLLRDTSHPVDDVHYLIALSRLSLPLEPQLRERVADSLVNLESKLQGRGLQRDRNWDLRVQELVQALTQSDPHLISAIISHPRFGHPGHIVLTSGAAPELRSRAAERVAQYLQRNPEESWTHDVVFLLSQSDQPRLQEIVRQQFDNFALRGAVILASARRPIDRDRVHFLTGLQSPDVAVLRASVEALEQLPASLDADDQFPLLEMLQKLGADKQERTLRDQVVQLLRRNLGQDFGYQFGLTAASPQTEAIAGWTEHLKRRFPDAAEERLRSSEQKRKLLQSRLESVDWNRGQSQRGEALFQTQACFSCHNTRTAVGPDLAGIGTRFSRDDLFTAIAYPNQNVSPRYNTTLIETVQGKVLSGLVIYESVDGLTLLDSTNQTIRVESDQVDVRHDLATSLMPVGLLDDLKSQDLADLYAYLRGL